MIDMKTSAEVAKETGLSVSRVNQFARTIKLEKVGPIFLWDEESIEFLKSRIGTGGPIVKNPCT